MSYSIGCYPFAELPRRQMGAADDPAYEGVFGNGFLFLSKIFQFSYLFLTQFPLTGVFFIRLFELVCQFICAAVDIVLTMCIERALGHDVRGTLHLYTTNLSICFFSNADETNHSF